MSPGSSIFLYVTCVVFACTLYVCIHCESTLLFILWMCVHHVKFISFDEQIPKLHCVCDLCVLSA